MAFKRSGFSAGLLSAFLLAGIQTQANDRIYFLAAIARGETGVIGCRTAVRRQDLSVSSCLRAHGFLSCGRITSYTSRIVEFRFAPMIGETRRFQRSVGSFPGTPCAEEPSLATWQKYGAGNSVIIDIDFDIDIDIDILV